MTPSPRRRMPESPTIDILIESELWDTHATVEDTLRRAIAEAASVTETTSGELAIVLTDDSAIRVLNNQWRGFDKATNVLSFPAADAATTAGVPFLLGDIIIAHETLTREAIAEHKPFEHHLTHLAVHGFLHLLGYDHETDSDAETMERLERTILQRLDVPDPYAARENDGDADHA